MKRLCEPRWTTNALYSADEDCGWVVSGARNDVEHPMHPIRKIDVDVARFTKHHFVAGCFSSMCVRCSILKAFVGFSFSDHESHFSAAIAPYQKFPDKFTRHDESRATKEGGGK